MATDQHDQVTAQIATLPPRMGMVRVDLIEESLTNPRKHFDSAKLQELADSIAATGVHQPILLRPLPGSRVAETSLEPLPPTAAWPLTRSKREVRPAYELVAGARRLRACRLAKVVEVPAMIRDMTDAEALEVQVIENLQREDVTPLEEAEGYEVLMRSGSLNADQVGAKIGKSRSYVYARLKVLDLCGKGREALREGLIDFSRGLLIARIPDEALQLKALEYCTQQSYQGDMPSYRSCAVHIQQNFMLKLSAARFKITDASLVPEAGSCRACNKRTGANPDLFADVDGADVCTDPKCYHGKEDAFTARMKADALAKGATIIDGREAKALMPYSYGSVEGHLRLDNKHDSPDHNTPLRKLIGKAMEAAGVQPTLIANPHNPGELIAVLTPEQVAPLLATAGHEELAQKAEKELQADEEAAKREAKAKQKEAYETAWRANVLAATWKAIEEHGYAASDDVLRLVVDHYVRLLNVDDCKTLGKLLGLGKVAPKDGVNQWATDARPAAALMVLLAYRDSRYYAWADRYADQRGHNENKTLRLIAAEAGVKVEAIQRTTKAEHDAANKAKAARETAKAAAPEVASTPPPAAQASSTRAKTKGKNRPAAPAGDEVPKTSKAHASAQIAEALAELEGNDQAPAAQGDEAPAVPGGQPAASAPPLATDGAAAQAHDVAPAAQGNEAQPVADAQAAAAPHGERSADVGDGAAASTVVVEVGQIVRVKEGLKSPGGKLRKICGRVCLVQRGGDSLMLRWGPRRDEMAVDVPAGDVEPYQAMPNIGSKVRMLINRDIGRMAREALVWRQGTLKAIKTDGWEVMFSARGNGVADVELVQPDELEALDD